MASFNKLEIYKEITDMSKELRRSINNMDRFHKFSIGERILNLLIDIKYQVYMCNTRKEFEKLDEMRKLRDLLTHLQICLNDCVEDGVLLLKTKFSIQLPLKRLHNIITQAIKWENYSRDYVNNLKINSKIEGLPF